jgi:hypothetical protein
MSRREFITLAGTSALWPLAVSAQQPIRVMTIGILGAATPAANGQFYAEFEKRLQELGWMKAAIWRLNTGGHRVVLSATTKSQQSSSG